VLAVERGHAEPIQLKLPVANALHCMLLASFLSVYFFVLGQKFDAKSNILLKTIRHGAIVRGRAGPTGPTEKIIPN